jgi:hypothetical protein
MEQRIEEKRGGVEVDLGVRGKGKLSDIDRKRQQGVAIGYSIADYLRRAHSMKLVITEETQQNLAALLNSSLSLFMETNTLAEGEPANDNWKQPCDD